MSASHWIKDVVEDVQRKGTAPVYGVPSSTAPSTTSATSGAAIPGMSASLPSQYLSYYQQYYQTQPAMHYSTTGYPPHTGYAASMYGSAYYPSYAAALTQSTAPAYPYVAPSFAPTQGVARPATSLTPAPLTSSSAPPAVSVQPVAAPPAVTASQTSQGATSSVDSSKKPNPQRFATQTASSGGKQQWPPNLKAFVEKTFAQCKDEGDRTFADAELRKRIAKVAADARLSVHKWELEYIALPSQQKLETEVQPVEENVSTPKKRKSRFDIAPPDISALGETAMDNIPEKRQNSIGLIEVIDERERTSREKRADRFSKTAVYTKKAAEAKQIRKESSKVSTVKGALSDEELEALLVVGTCEVPEKEYFRLTSAPDPSTVRPERVLRQALATLHEKWEQKSVDYVYMCSQLKAIRQDLTVQHIRNDFTVSVYETHARAALQSRDLNEYNQCQTQLKHLYSNKLKGSEMEFIAYRILYYVYLKENRMGGNADMINCLSSLPPGAEEDINVSHALKIRRTLQEENYHSFFKLYRTVPNLGNCILNMNMNAWRLQYLQRIVKAYKPTVEANFVLSELHLSHDSEGLDFLRSCGAILFPQGETVVAKIEINTKDTVIDTATVLTQETNLL